MNVISQGRPLPFIGLALITLAACVTINVYFPEAAATKAADSVVCEVLGTCEAKPGAGKKGDSSSSNREPVAAMLATATEHSAGTAPFDQRPAVGYALLSRALNALVPVAQAQTDIDVNSPGSRDIRQSMEARQQKLQPFLASGAIGFTNDGLVDVRDLGAVPLPQRGSLRSLVAAENNDRRELYAEIARVNGNPDWAGKIQSAFAERWIARASSGWYYQDPSGNWTQK